MRTPTTMMVVMVKMKLLTTMVMMKLMMCGAGSLVIHAPAGRAE